MVPSFILLEIEDGDWTDNGIIAVTILNAITVAVVFLVYSVLQSSQRFDYVFYKRSALEHGPKNTAGSLATTGDGTSRFLGRPNGLFGWVAQSYRMPLDEVVSRCGLDAAAYLLVMRNMAVATLAVGIVCAAPLMAVNDADDEYKRLDAENDEEVLFLRGYPEWTTANMEKKSDSLWVHLVCMVAVTLIVLATIAKTIKDYLALRERYSRRKVVDVAAEASSHTVMLSPLGEPDAQRGYPSWETVSKWVSSKIRRDAHRVVSAPHVPKAAELRSKELDAERRLRHAESWLKVKGEREIVKVGKLAPVFGSKVDALDHYTAELAKIRGEIDALLKSSNTWVDTGVRFVVLERELDALALLGSPDHSRVAFVGNCKYKMSPAPRPDAVEWDNLRFTPKQRLSRRAAMGFFIVLLSIFWAIPLAFLGSLEAIASIPGVGSAFEKLLDMPPVLLGFINSFLPVIAAIVLTLVIQILVRKFARLEGHHADNRVSTRAMQIFTYFLIASTVIFPALAMGVLSSAAQLAENFEDSPGDTVLDLLAQIVSPRSGYFVAYVIQLAFAGTMFKVLRLGPLIMGKFKLSRAVTSEDREAALTVSPYNFLKEYGIVMLVSALVLTFAVTVPFITAFGWIFFSAKYFIDKVTLVNTFPSKFSENSGLFVSALNRIVFCLLLGLAAAVVTFISKEAYAQLVITAIIFIIVPVYMIVSMKGVKAGKSKEYDERVIALKGSSRTDEADLGTFASCYRHPIHKAASKREETMSEEFGAVKGGQIVAYRSADSTDYSAYSDASYTGDSYDEPSYESSGSYESSYDGDTTDYYY